MARDLKFSKKHRNSCSHRCRGQLPPPKEFLYYTGVSHKIGEVHDECSYHGLDGAKNKKGYNNYIQHATTCNWTFLRNKGKTLPDSKKYHFNIIDTPGHVDFTVEVNRSLRVLDGLVFLFSSVDGVEPQSETNWRLADNYKVPRIRFVNKMDRQGSNFLNVCNQVRDMLKSNAVPIVLPMRKRMILKDVSI